MTVFRFSLLAAASLPISAASAQDHSAIQLQPSAPAVVSTTGTPTFGPLLVQFVPGPALCEGGAISPIAIEAPFPVHTRGSKGPLAPITVRFAIDASGRPTGIEREPAPSAGRSLFYSDEDLLPSFAASRFASGNARSRCRIEYEVQAFPVREAPLHLAQRYYVAPHVRQETDGRVFRRLHPAETNCIRAGMPKLRTRAFPAFEKIPQAPGTWSFAMTGFDIDAKGRPVNVRVTGSSGNAELDRESVAAVKRSRFAAEPRQGCAYPYYRRQKTPLAPPPMPDKASFVAADAPCPAKDTAWTRMPPLSFPAGFARRRIEGWAIVAYDVAPWGQTGNVRVLAAEPAAAFGLQAKRIVSGAQQAPSATGRSGCVDVVRFRFPGGDREREETSSE